MAPTDIRTVAVGVVLLAVSTVLILGPATLGTNVPEAHRALRWWVREGRAALDAGGR
jgi:hypothetical protein